MKINPLRAKYGNESRWVNYRIEEREGKKTKVPHSFRGGLASSTNPETWGTLDECMKVSKECGIVFTPEKNLLGIDIDHCLVDGEIQHESKESIVQLISAANTYTEVSPSGTGLHLYLALSESVTLTASRHGNFEAYTSGRYFTVTGKSFGEAKEVREIEEMEAISLLSIIGYPWGKDNRKDVGIHTDSIDKNVQSEGSQPTIPNDIRRDDQSIIDRMFSSKNGSQIKALYNGDLTQHGGDNSKADMALCSHLAFWTGKNAEQMERMWVASPLGTREKTHTRADYRASTIGQAITKCNNVYEDPREKQSSGALSSTSEDIDNPAIELLFTLNAKRDVVYTLNTENICRVLRHHPAFKGKLRYDAFKNIIEVQLKNGKWRMLEDNDDVLLQTRIQVLFPPFGKVGKEMVHDALVAIAQENAIDSAADFMRGLVWDGTARLDTWLTKTIHAPDDAYHRAVSSNVLKGMVKRIMHPGCKFDYVLVLEGEQGFRKSSTLSVLGGDWYVETTMATDNKDFFMQLPGKCIIEFSEGETLSRTEVKRLKGVITTPVDRYRPSYGRNSIDFPRRCIFTMTTNQSEYLKDETGNRRWLPVKVERVADTEWLQNNREQLFAEAYHRVETLGETVHEFPEEETKKQQALRQVRDPNTDLICDWYSKLLPHQKDEGVTVHQAYRDAICGGYVNKPLDRFMEGSITNIFKNIMCLSNNRKRVDGIQVRRWFSEGDVELPEFAVQPLTGLEKW